MRNKYEAPSSTLNKDFHDPINGRKGLVSNVWGLYWRTFIFIIALGAVVLLAWQGLVHQKVYITVFGPTVINFAIGFIFIISSFFKGGLVSVLFGHRLYLENTTWKKYHLFVGATFCLHAVVLYGLYLSGNIGEFVSFKTVGSVFCIFIAPLIFGFLSVKYLKS